MKIIRFKRRGRDWCIECQEFCDVEGWGNHLERVHPGQIDRFEVKGIVEEADGQYEVSGVDRKEPGEKNIQNPQSSGDPDRTGRMTLFMKYHNSVT